jgi:hypothetical protein
MAKDKPAGWRVVRGSVSIQDVLAEYERLHPDPWSDPSYAAAKAEMEAGGTTVYRFRRPDAVPGLAQANPGEPTREEVREQERREAEGIRARLVSEGARYHGYGTIGKEAGWSIGKVRSLLGKREKRHT